MRKSIFLAAMILAVAPLSAFAQHASPAGRYTTIDDKTKKPKSIVEVWQASNGTIQAKVVQVLQSDKGPHPVCDKCSGSNKDKPVEGMTILWGLKPDGVGKWSGGTVLDPATGKTYKAKLESKDGGKRLGMSGCIAFICREQNWIKN